MSEFQVPENGILFHIPADMLQDIKDIVHKYPGICYPPASRMRGGVGADYNPGSPALKVIFRIYEACYDTVQRPCMWYGCQRPEACACASTGVCFLTAQEDDDEPTTDQPQLAGQGSNAGPLALPPPQPRTTPSRLAGLLQRWRGFTHALR
jgi:hypothetical protein